MQLNVLILDNVSKIFHQDTTDNLILNKISYHFYQGESYAVVGPSGVGKSTLLHMMAGFEQPTSGTIRYNGKDIYSFSESELQHYLQDMIGFVFQTACLVPELTVRENIMLKGMFQRHKKNYDEQKMKFLLDTINLFHKKDEYPYNLSGGEQQRVALARALYSTPVFLIADECTAHLDHENKINILELIFELQKIFSFGIIMSTHDNLVLQVIKNRIILSQFSLVEKQSL